ncbi:MAG: HD domain-containing protein, partial [Lachnospiraceae bacterium]|nr:HD domain-containing protein [Lachnospiraceae bacterium]
MKKNIKQMLKNLRIDIYRGYKRESNINVITIVCAVFSVVMLAFTIINLIQGYYNSMLLSLTSFILFGLSGTICWLKKNREIPAILITLGVGLLCTFYTIRGTSEGFAILWTTLLPIALMYFLNVRFGIYFSIYFEILFIVCFLTPIREHITGYSDLFMARYPLLYLCIVVIDSIAMIQYHNNTLEQYEYDARLSDEVETMTRRVNERSEQIEEMSFQMIQTLANAIDAKDTYTKEHSLRVSQYSVALARALGWNERRISRLRYDAMVHDIGKIGIPDDILNKKARLTEEEFEIIQSHTIRGYQIFENTTAFPTAKLVARHHHERFDGTGYPDHLKGKDIPENARIVCIADAFDAMSSDRCYRKALSIENIREEIEKGAGTEFDPEYAEVFIKLLDDKVITLKDIEED